MMTRLIDLLETNEGTEKVANYGSDAIKLQIRELGFARKIFSFDKVNRNDPQLQRRTDIDEVYMLVPIEPQAGAVTTNFRSDAPTEWVKEQRIELGFGRIESAGFEKSEVELWATMQPLMETIKQYCVFEVQRQEDANILGAFDQAAEISGKYVDATSSKILSKEVLREGRRYLDDDLLEAKQVLCAKDDLNDAMLWDSMGYGYGFVQSLVEGDKISKLNNLFGLEFITSIKSDLFRTVYFVADSAYYGDADVLTEEVAGETQHYTANEVKAKVAGGKYEHYKTVRHIYLLPDRKYLGDARSLQDLTFHAKKEKDKYKMGSYETVGCFVIANAVVKLDLGQ